MYRIAGIDVHKRMLAVVIADVAVEGEYQFERRKVGTSPSEICRLAEWLVAEQVEEVVMESTAQYWRPVWATLERLWRPKRLQDGGAKSGKLHLAQAQSNRRLSIKLCLKVGSSSLLKARLKHGIELSESRSDGPGDSSPSAVLQGRDSQSEFELQGIFGMKVSATVPAHDFKLAVDRFDNVGGRKRFAHVFGIFQKRQVVFSFFA